MKDNGVFKIYLENPWQLDGQYWKSPVVLMTEGVAAGSHGPLFWSGEVLKKIAADWHDVPVTLDHPKVDGFPVSVNHSPEIFANHVIGYVQEPHYDPYTKSLKATIRVPQGITGINQIQELKEVSIGIFSKDLIENGFHKGQAYHGRVLGGEPDHLAILPKGAKGACSWEAGCGIRANSREYQLLQALAQNNYNYLDEGEIPMTNEMLLPTGVEKSDTNFTIQDLQALQEAADENELLLPASMNINLTRPKKQGQGQDYQDDEMLLPQGVE
jgi:hypothetical protein